MSPGQTGHITGQMGRVPGTDGDAHQGVSRQNSLCLLFFFFPHSSSKLYLLKLPFVNTVANQSLNKQIRANPGFKRAVKIAKLKMGAQINAKQRLKENPTV